MPSCPRLYSATLSAIFGLAIATGLLGAFVPYDSVPSLQELRTYATFPSLAELTQPTRVPGRITAFFSDNFGGRKLLVREHFRFRLKVLHSDVGMGAVLGNDKSLVIDGELQSSRHLQVIAPGTLERMRLLLNSWCAYARARDAAFVFVVAPNKTTVHPFIRDYLPVKDRPSVIDTIYAVPLDCPVIKVDLRAALRREAAGKLLYYKWGTHWNAHGSLIMWRSIREAVEREGPRFAWPSSRVTVTQRPAAMHEDSMWAWYGLLDPERIMLDQFAFSETTYESPGAVALPRARILAFGDSFMFWARSTPGEIMGSYSAFDLDPQNPFSHQAADLAKDGWIISAQPPQKRIELMDIFRPNIVVLEVVERSITEIADFVLAPEGAR